VWIVGDEKVVLVDRERAIGRPRQDQLLAFRRIATGRQINNQDVTTTVVVMVRLDAHDLCRAGDLPTSGVVPLAGQVATNHVRVRAVRSHIPDQLCRSPEPHHVLPPGEHDRAIVQ